jgi:hypothetical protein
MFQLGSVYTRQQIHDRVGGNLQSFLPDKDGRVVAACLRLDRNPDAPGVILAGEGEGIERAAELLAGQRESLPTFLKRRIGEWEYVGQFVVQRCSHDPEEISAHSRASGRSDIILVIHMVPAGTLSGRPSNGIVQVPEE